jgi:RHS repeat-associated protein
LLAQYTDARNGSSLYEFDNDGFLTKDTRPDGSWQTFSRNGTLAPTSVTRTTALGRTETFAVSRSAFGDSEARNNADAAGLHTLQSRSSDHAGSVTYPDGTTVTTSELADPRFGIQASYAATTTTRMPSGLTRTESRSRSVTLSNPQDPLSLSSLIESVTVSGHTSQSSYNASSRRMTLTSAAGRVTAIDYDALGRVTQISAPGVYPTQLHYDARGRNDTISQGTRVTALAYRADGFLDNILDPLLQRTSFGYDAAGRPTSQTLPDLSVIGLGYDANGNATSVTPPGRPAHIFAFTAGDQEKDYTPPDVGQPRTTHTDYNLDQQVLNVSRPDRDYITPTYDPVKNRLTALATSRGTNTYGYSPTTGQLTSVATFDGVGLTYGYDGSLLKDITWSGPVSGNVHKTYDSSFRLASESVTGGQTINFGYDNDDLLTSAGAMTITRDPTTGFVTGTTLGAISESRTYDAYGAEQTYTVTANSTTLYSVNYGTRDALGRIVNKTETVQGTTHVYGYTYDANGRLTDVTADGNATSHYEYDANGNRLVGPGLTASPVYDSQDRLLSYGSCSYTYKNDGSLQIKICPAGTTTYDYDAFGNLRHVTLPSGTSIDYLIDGQNRRIGKKVNGTLVEGFVYRSQLQPAAWLNPDGSTKATFVYAGSNAPAYMVVAGTTYRLIKDQVGSVRLVENTSTGAVAERIDYDEFGNVLADTAPGTQPFGFAGGLRELDTGLTRFGARDYDPATGRWTKKDPLRFGGGLLDLYAYVNSDPINRKDPSGLQALPLGPPPQPLWLVPPLPPVPYASTAPSVLDWLASGAWAPWLAPVAVLLAPSPIGRDTCSEAYPGMIDCGALGPDFKFDTEAQAFTLAKALNPGVRKHTRADADMCQGGTHVDLRCGKDRAGSLLCCPCCEDTTTGILTQNKCAYIP